MTTEGVRMVDGVVVRVPGRADRVLLPGEYNFMHLLAYKLHIVLGDSRRALCGHELKSPYWRAWMWRLEERDRVCANCLRTLRRRCRRELDRLEVPHGE